MSASNSEILDYDIDFDLQNWVIFAAPEEKNINQRHQYNHAGYMQHKQNNYSFEKFLSAILQLKYLCSNSISVKVNA